MDSAYIDEMGLTPDGVPLEGLLTTLSGLVCHTSPWWTPSGTDPTPLPPGLTVSIDVTVPLNHLTDLLPDDTTPDGYQTASNQYMKIDLLIDYNNPTNIFYVKNVRKTGQIILTKYDSRDQNVLPGAEFKVYDYEIGRAS